MMWCDVMWCDGMWCDVMGCDVMWCDVMWWRQVCYLCRGHTLRQLVSGLSPFPPHLLGTTSRLIFVIPAFVFLHSGKNWRLICLMRLFINLFYFWWPACLLAVYALMLVNRWRLLWQFFWKTYLLIIMWCDVRCHVRCDVMWWNAM